MRHFTPGGLGGQGMGSFGMGSFGGGLGGLPFPVPGPPAVQLQSPARAGGLSPIAPVFPVGLAPADPYNVTPIQQQNAAANDPQVELLRMAARRLIWTTHPSPLEAPPYRGRYEDKWARSVIAPPTAPGNAAATTGATEISDAEESFTGLTIPVLTPATTADYVEVLSFTVDPGRAFVVHKVGAWAHDTEGSRDAISWRIRTGSRILSADRELGILGGMDNPLLLRDVARPGEKVVIEARNLDTESATLIEVRLQGWSFPLLQASDDDFFSLLDPYMGPSDQGRFSEQSPA